MDCVRVVLECSFNCYMCMHITSYILCIHIQCSHMHGIIAIASQCSSQESIYVCHSNGSSTDLAVDANAVIVVFPFRGCELDDDLQTQSRDETAPLEGRRTHTSYSHNTCVHQLDLSFRARLQVTDTGVRTCSL